MHEHARRMLEHREQLLLLIGTSEELLDLLSKEMLDSQSEQSVTQSRAFIDALQRQREQFDFELSEALKQHHVL
jgi:hypothetical protein